MRDRQVVLTDPAVMLLAQAASTFPVILKAILIFSGIILKLLLGLSEAKSSKDAVWMMVLNVPKLCCRFKCKSLSFA